MGQKISTKPIDKSAQDAAKYRLMMLLIKLINLDPSYGWVEYQNYN